MDIGLAGWVMGVVAKNIGGMLTMWPSGQW